MKLVHITCQVQYTEMVEAILARRELKVWVRHGRVSGRDRDGRHEGSQAFPGRLTAFQVQVPDEDLDGVLADLRTFRDSKRAHGHLEALVVPVDRALGGGDGEEGR